MSNDSKPAGIEKRQHARMPGTFDVRLVHPVFGEVVTRTSDMSNGGFFVELDGVPFPDIGSIIQMQLIYATNGIEAKPRPMEVVRITDGGMGLRFID